MFQLHAIRMSTLTFAHSHTLQHTLVLLILFMKGMMLTVLDYQVTPLTRKGVIAQGDQWALNGLAVGEIFKALVWRLRRGNSD